ncbi:MAG: NAD(P)H-binding protein [Balneolaceae bacterium]|nr:NAD(P)H-binding protein [Balneolaceae bacterium]
MSDAVSSLAVIGATGMLGKHVTRELHRAGFSVRALVRDPGKAKGVLPDEVEVVRADLRRPVTLLEGMKGMDGLYVSISTGPHEQDADFRTQVEGVRNLLDAAAESGVRRIGYLSSMVCKYSDYDWWVFDYQRRACDMLRTSELTTLLFYPSNFYENITELQMSGGRIMLGGSQKTQSWWVGASDYGKQVAAAFRLEDRSDREYVIQGPDAYNWREAAEEFIEHYDARKLKTMWSPLWPFRLMGFFSNTLDFQYQILKAINHYDEKFAAEETWKELGRPQTSLADFARQTAQKER